MKKINPETHTLSIDKNIPESVKHLVSQNQYNKIIDIVIGYFKTNADKKIRLQDGLLSVISQDGITLANYYMESLVRHLNVESGFRWKPMIYKYLGLQFNVAAHNYFMDDYENACQYLKILVKSEKHATDLMKNTLIHTKHFPGALSFLVFNYNEQFIFLGDNHVKNWAKSTQELMEQALYNVSKEKVEVLYTQYKEAKIHNIASAQYSAARMIELEKNLPEVMGVGGALFIIPCNGMAFATPLNDKDQLFDTCQHMMRLAKMVYDNEPSPITFDVFRYFEGEVTSFLDTLREEIPYMYNLVMSKL